ncbi:MAG: amino acid adenylation domain-containing protein [Verrucomicrobia bacterium]|nr:amino acid adenylation domain-containing protein [Verrucomicrobiota bacterium]MDA1065324.1 amino acid adenylation domain-containing protein [Verrucomicrobiota bacterium]
MKKSVLSPTRASTNLVEQLNNTFASYSKNIAIETDKVRVSYGQLEIWVQQLIHKIQPALTDAEPRIAVLSDHPLEYIAAMLAAFRLGALYVPMDPSFPKLRFEQILSEVRPTLILLGDMEKTPDLGENYETMEMPTFTGETETTFDPLPERTISEEAPAYLFFTSGSTGKPKGIVGKLSSLRHFSQWEADEFNLNSDSTISQFTTPTFDAFLRDVITPLSIGGTICIPPQRPAMMGAEALWDWIESKQISLIHCVPSLFSALLEGTWKSRVLCSLKHILLAGEALPLRQAENWINHFHQRIELVNLYGSTETTMVKLFHRIRKRDVEGGFIPVGQPMSETEVVILNDQKQICQVNEIGEIFIATAHRTLGYFNQPEATAQVFIDNPYTTDLAYATGDLGTVLPDGNIRLFGRKDRQVKVGGVRIEPEEVESALLKIVAIKACAVTVNTLVEHRGNLITKEAVQNTIQSGNPQAGLTGYLVLKEQITISEIRKQLADHLPSAAIPRTFFSVEDLPRNTNGKIDYFKLGEMNTAKVIRDQIFEPPISEVERTVARLWESVLNVPTIGRHDDFFTLGGDSLTAMQVMNRMREFYNGSTRITDLLTQPSLKDFCQIVEKQQLDRPIAQKGSWVNLDANSETTYPLTPAQKGLWFLWKMDPESPYYTCQGIIHIKGRFDENALQESWSLLQQRHDILRVRFGNVSGSPTQHFVNNSEPWVLGPKVDHLEGKEAVQKIRDLAKKEAQTAFNLEDDSLLRVKLYKIGADHHALQLTMHEITIDLWGIRILLNDLAALYEQALNKHQLLLESKGPSFRQFLLWQDSHKRSGSLDETYWKSELSGQLPVLNLPLDRPRSPKPNYQGKTIHCLLDEELTEKLKSLSQEQGNTLYVTLLAGFFWTLHRYSGQEDIIVGSPIAQRNQAESEDLIGFFLNMLPIRLTVKPHQSVRHFISSIRKKVNGAIEASEYSFTNMLEWAQSVRDTSISPVFQVMFNMLSYTDRKLEFSDFSLGYESLETGHTKYDFSMYAQEYGGKLFLQIAYQTELFDESTMQRFLKNLETFYRSIVEGIDPPLNEIESLHPTEKKQLMTIAKGPTMEIADDRSLITIFQDQVGLIPNATALIHQGKVLSYSELNTLTDQLARVLAHSGNTFETPVAISQTRSFHMVAAILAVMKMGATYVYLDPQYPEARNRAMLEDIDPSLLIADEPEAFEKYEKKIIPWGERLEIHYAEGDKSVDVVPKRNDLFSIVYTSASTGRPKGVQVRERAVLNRLQWMWEAHPFSDIDVMLLQKSLSLVASSWECLGGLLAGVPTVIADHDTVIDPAALASLCNQQNVTRIYGSPALFAGVMAQRKKSPGNFISLKLAFSSAEPISPSQVQEWSVLFPSIPLFNLYGSSECSSNALSYDCSHFDPGSTRVPIGKPLPNINTFVLDKDLRLVPKGAAGELCISGTCLAAGYQNLPKETEEKFIQVNPDRFGGPVLYKTGDLVRLGQNNQLEYLGRNDFQIKIRGFRIELEEVENCLASIPEIEACVVCVDSSIPEEPKMIAFVQCDNATIEKDLRQTLRKQLPDYMIPSQFVFLPNLPRTASGKIDRSSLKTPSAQDLNTNSPETADIGSLESSMALLWRQHLANPNLGVDDNFFDLGGHSLLAAKLFSEIEKLTGKAFPLSALYRAPTIRELCRLLEEDGLTNLWSSLVPMNQGTSKPPLFCLPPWGGSAYFFRYLTKYLNKDQPFYTLESCHNQERETTSETLNELIQKNFDEIMSFYPEGPLFLCGFSGGGVIAWELANRLTAHGRTVDNVILFDTSYPRHTPNFIRKMNSAERYKSKARGLVYSIRRLNGWHKLWFLIETVFMKVKWHLIPQTSEQKEAIEQEVNSMETKRSFFTNYSASNYAGKVTIFKAKERRLETLSDPTLGWSEHTEREIELCEVPGSHNTMLIDPNGETLCMRLQTLLTKHG